MWRKILSIVILFCALAVLWFSMRWVWKESNDPEAQIATAQAVGGLFTLLAAAAFWQKKTKRKQADFLTVSYMRLFGAVEVPLLMKLIGNKGPFPPFDGMPYCKGPGGTPISYEMGNFWITKWAYKEALPVLNDMWSHYCGDRWAGVNLYFNSLRPTPEDLLTFSSCFEVDAACCLAPEVAEHHNLTYDQEWYPNGGTGTKPSNIAFLFVILQNKTGAILENLELELKSHKNPLQLRSFESKHLFVPLSEWPNPQDQALTDDLINLVTPKTESKKVAVLREGESLIMVLSAYRANSNGFPEFYLTDVTASVQVSANLNELPVKQMVRKPYFDKAAKIMVPNGWFHQ